MNARTRKLRLSDIEDALLLPPTGAWVSIKWNVYINTYKVGCANSRLEALEWITDTCLPWVTSQR